MRFKIKIRVFKYHIYFYICIFIRYPITPFILFATHSSICPTFYLPSYVEDATKFNLIPRGITGI